MANLDRRNFLGACLAAAAGAALAGCRGRDGNDGPSAATAQPPPAGAIIDTHTHFYDPSRPQGVPWPAKGDALLYRTVLPAEYRRAAGPLGITGTVVVEASPWVEDNQWLLDLARDEPFIVGVVGNLAPGEPGFAAHLPRFAKDRLFRGIRLRDRPWAGRLGDPALSDDLRRLADADLSVDVNVGPAGLPDVARLADAAPALRIVVDHVGNVPVGGRPLPAEWLAGVRAVAGRPNVWCKVSGLVEGTRRRNADAPSDVQHYRLVLDAVWDAFGEDRLIYGTNWPVSARFAPLATVHGIARDYLAGRGPAAAEKVLWRNAKAAYKWVNRGAMA